MITDYQQRTIIFSIVLVMLSVVLSYFTYITIGLFIIFDDVNNEIKYVTVHNTKSETVSMKDELKSIPKETTLVGETLVVDTPSVNEDLQLLAQIINAEAGNQPYKGKIAVGNVILNRVEHSGFPDTIEDVVYQKGQFQPVRNGAIHKTPNEESKKAAREVLNGNRVVHEDVLYFYNPDISTSGWIFTREVVTKIGEHAFAI